MLNTVILQGRLTANPELRTTPSGISVTAFSIAVDDSHSKDKTYFFEIVAWRNTAEFICKYFTKGQMILISGELQERKYQDRDGNNRKAVEVVASQVNFCGKKEETRQETSSYEENDYMDFFNDQDLPF